MTRSIGPASSPVLSLMLAVMLMGMATGAQAEKLPPLWGYRIKSCDDFLKAAESDAEGGDLMALEYGRYEDWLTGFISGLNLSTGKDVLRGADIENALGRIHAYCKGHRREDFFTATMDLVRMLSGLR